MPTGEELNPGTHWRTPDTLWVYDKTLEFGMNSFHYTPREIGLLTNLNLRVVRLTLEVDRWLANADGSRDVFESYINAACSNGLVPLVVVHSAGGLIGSPYGDYDAFASFMGNAAALYPCVRYWQLFNEIEVDHAHSLAFGTGETGAERYNKGWYYAQMLKKAYPAIKAASGAQVVTTGVYSAWGNNATVVDGIYGGGGKAYFDILAYHHYSDVAQYNDAPSYQWECPTITGAGLRSRLDCLKLLLANHGDVGRPVFLTEYGYDVTGDPHGPHSAAGYDLRQRLMYSDVASIASASGIVTKIFGHTLSTDEKARAATDDWATGYEPLDHTLGLTRRDFTTPRPTYWYLRDTSHVNDHVFAYPFVSGWVTVYSPAKRPVGLQYFRSGGNVTFFVTLNKLSGVNVVFEPEPAPPSVTISGPSTVRRYTSCTWYAAASGGVQPLSYSWNVGGSSPWVEYYAVGSSFTLSVTVAGANGQSTTVSKTVTVSSTAPICPS
jgi:hypothetical protein